MKHEGHMKTAFTRECGSAVSWVGVKTLTNGAVEITFRINSTGRNHCIGTNPVASSREAHETAAAQAGRWASVMADRAAAA